MTEARFLQEKIAHHADEARKYADQASEALGENAIEAAELAAIATAHAQAATATAIGEGYLSAEVELVKFAGAVERRSPTVIVSESVESLKDKALACREAAERAADPVTREAFEDADRWFTERAEHPFTPPTDAEFFREPEEVTITIDGKSYGAYSGHTKGYILRGLPHPPVNDDFDLILTEPEQFTIMEAGLYNVVDGMVFITQPKAGFGG